jgi:signal transduction histidine kinase
VLKGIIGNGSIGFEADKVIDKAIRDLRAISRNLLPPELASIGFNKAVVNLVAFMESASKISFTFVSFGEEFRFEENKELNIFRIVSELLNNVLKHSKATKATIQLIYHQSHLFISVEDNGIGIETDKNLWGIGLKNIYSRTELLNAKLVVDSNPKGSTFILEIPY